MNVRIAIPILLLAGALLVSPGCFRGDDLDRYAPDLDDDIRTLLRTDDDERFLEMAEHMGEPRLTAGWHQLIMSTTEGVPGALEAIRPHAERLADATERILGTPFRRHNLDVLSRIAPADLAAWTTEWQRLRSVYADADLPDSVKVSELVAAFSEVERLGMDWYATALNEMLARIHTNQGQPGMTRARLETALADARRTGDAWTSCQILGALAEFHDRSGRPDSTAICLDMAQGIADRARLAYQAARIRAFRSAYLSQSGRIGAAYLMLREARDECRRLKGGGLELRWLLAEIDFLDRMGCWTMIEDLVAEGEILGDRPPYHLEPFQRDYLQWKLQLAKGRSLFASGSRGDALRVMERLAGSVQPRPIHENYASVHHEYAGMLLESGRHGEALDRASAGLAHSRDNNLPFMAARFELLLARIAVTAGRYDGAESHLAALDDAEAGIRPGDIAKSAEAADLRLRIALARPHDGRATAALADAFATLDHALRCSDHTVTTYLALDRFDALRWTIHGIIAHDPALGVAFENRWRALIARHVAPGDAPPPPVADTDPVSWIRSWVRGDEHAGFVDRALAASRDAGTRTVLLAYLVTDVGAVRWSVADGAVERGSVTTGSADLRTLTADLLSTASRHPGDAEAPLPSDTELVAGALARALLPASVLDDPPDRLMVMADDVLESLPFGILSLTDGRRLGDATDLVKLRYDGCGTATAPASPLVVANPTIDMDVRRHLSGLSDLPGAEAEGRTVVNAWPGSHLLAGRAADKARVLRGAEDASRLYFASHVVSRAESPFLKCIPLVSSSGRGRFEDSILEMSDILALDLSGCELVVLSGCSSGTPYVTGARTAPAFGDVFLDAGARSAVQTLWRVDDEAIVPVMEAFVEDVADDAGVWNLARALRRAREPLMRGTGATAHPYWWGSLVLVTTDPGF